VDYNYFMDFPMILDIDGHNNSIRQPFLIPPTVHSLDLRYNKLRTTLDFFNTSVSYNHLGSIRLDYNNISVLQSGSFKGFKSLTLLSLSYMDNGIHELESNCIVDLPLISRIDINANKISHIPHDALLNLSSSRSPLTFHLDLRKNHMTELPEKFLDLPHLTHLDLSKGKLQTIHPLAFSRTPHLKVMFESASLQLFYS
jgi:Leucine-rich repeat (LRR) protein